MQRAAGARQRHDLLAGAIDLGDLGDRRRFGENALIIVAALIVARRARPRRPADLAFEIGEELLDPARRRVGFLALRMQQRVLRVAVGDVDVERAADRQHEGDQPDEIGDIFAKQALAAKQAAQQIGGRLRRDP